MYSTKLILLAFSLVFVACSSTTKRLNASDDLTADSGELTRGELEKAAEKLSQKVKLHFDANKPAEGIFVAFLPTKNDTSDQLPVQVFDNRLVGNLLAAKIYTVRVEDRNKALSEIAFSQTGATANGISAGNMKSPNFFIQTDITENIFRSGGDRIVEQTLNFEMRSVETQLVVFSDRVVYRKKPRNQKGGLTW
ncbi:MAG: penicillin-binding protein activator LpoB [Spirochaetes bacterium]|nr:penicillin-binding protein activator LpoB [Spirochaetota bacterium]